MAQIDLSYLDRFAGEPVRIENRVDPDYHQDKTSIEQKGRLMPGNRWGKISFIEGFLSDKDNDGKIVMVDMGDGIKMPSWSGAKGCLPSSLPYLGYTRTVWEIQRLKDSSLLFSHRQVGPSEYEILNAEKEILGTLFIQSPYQTPYIFYAEDIDTRIAGFLEWQKDLIVVPGE